jgi:hypothetical protein
VSNIALKVMSDVEFGFAAGCEARLSRAVRVVRF